MNKNIIGLCGYPGSGKTTAANVLSEFGYERRSFADQLKRITKKILRVNELNKAQHRNALIYISQFVKDDWWFPETVYDLMEREYGVDPDLFYGVLTSNLQREFGLTFVDKYWFTHDFWVQAALQNLPEKVVFDDCRYPVEYDMIKERGGLLVEIASVTEYCAQNLIARDGGYQPDLFTLPSETNFLNFNVDYAIKADWKLEEFVPLVRQFAMKITNTGV